MSKTIYGRSSVNLTVDSLSFLSITANDINATNSSITNIEGTNLTYTNANISTLNVSDINIDELNINTVNLSNINASNGNISTLVGTDLDYTNASINSSLNCCDIDCFRVQASGSVECNELTNFGDLVNVGVITITGGSGLLDMNGKNISDAGIIQSTTINTTDLNSSGVINCSGDISTDEDVNIDALKFLRLGGSYLQENNDNLQIIANNKNVNIVGQNGSTARSTIFVSSDITMTDANVVIRDGDLNMNSNDINNINEANASTMNVSNLNASVVSFPTLDISTLNASTVNGSDINACDIVVSSDILAQGRIQGNTWIRSQKFVSNDITPITIINSSNGSTVINASSINCSFTTTMNTLETNNCNASQITLDGNMDCNGSINVSTLNASNLGLSSIDLTTANVSTINVSDLNISGDTNSSGSFIIPEGEDFKMGQCFLQQSSSNLQIIGTRRNINIVGQNGSSARSTIYISGSITMTDAPVIIRDDNLNMNNNDINNINTVNCSTINTTNATITTIDSLSDINSSFNVSGFLNASSFSATRNATESTSYTADSIQCKTNLELLSNALVSGNRTRLTLGVNELNVSGGDLNMNGSDIVNCSEMNASIYYYPLQSISLSPKLHVGYHQGFTTQGVSGTTTALTWGRGYWLRQTSGSPLNISEFYTGSAQAWEPLTFTPSIPSAQTTGLGYRLIDLGYKGLWKVRAIANFINPASNTRKVPAITIQNVSDGGNVALGINDNNTNLNEFTKVISIDGQYSAGGNYARYGSGRMATLTCERVMYVDTNTNYVGLRGWLDNGGGIDFIDTQDLTSGQAQDMYISINFEYLGNYTLN